MNIDDTSVQHYRTEVVNHLEGALSLCWAAEVQSQTPALAAMKGAALVLGLIRSERARNAGPGQKPESHSAVRSS